MLGPLGFRPAELWSLTWGEAEDLIEAWRYSEFLESQRRAQLACWLLNGSGNLKHAVHISDLVGHWADGQVLNKSAYLEYLGQKIKAKKGGESRG